MRYLVLLFCLLTNVASAQCYDPCVIYTQPVLQHKIVINEPIRTKSYIFVTLSDTKRKVTVPIINGLQPTLKIQYSNGIELHTFDYTNQSQWDGNKIWNKSDIPKVVTPESVPKLKKLSDI